MPHTIRLHGPWTYRIFCSDGELEGTFRIPGSLDITGHSQITQIWLIRLFHRPTGISEKTRLYIAGTGELAAGGTLYLNDISLGPASNQHFRCETTARLLDSNQLVLRMAANSGWPGSIGLGHVALEIHE